MTRLRHILLTLLLAVAFGAAGQTYVIDSVCVGSERHYRIDGEANSTYAWSLTDPVGTIINLPETADTVTILWNGAVGEYILSVIQTSIHGCDSLELGTIRVFEIPEADAGEDVTLCSSNPYTLINATASEFMNLQWTSTGDGSFDDATLLNPTYTFGPSDISLGTVTLTLTATGFGREGSCPPAESQVTITFGDLQTDNLITNVSCYGLSDGSVQLVASGGTEPYTFELEGIVHADGLYEGYAAGDYNFTITDASGCTISGTVTITQPDELTVNINGINPSIPGGNDGEAAAIVTGGTPPYTYLWDDPLAQTTATATGLVAGTYTVEVTDANGCRTNRTITLTEPTSDLAITAIVDRQVTCFGYSDGQATATATGGEEPYSYLWSDPMAQTTATATNLPAGTYTVSVTDATGYSVNTTVIITQPDELIVNVSGTNPTTPGGSDGQATAVVTGGTLPYTYLWDDPMAQTTATATGLTAGTYTVFVTDANGCRAEKAVTLTDPGPGLNAIAMVDQNVSCFGYSDGQATVTVTGGTPPYTYLWDDPAAQTTPTATNLQAGNYSVTVTDADGSSVTASVTIMEPNELIVNVGGINPSVSGGNDGEATAFVNGGTVPYTYVWDDPAAQTTATATGLTAGTYHVTVTDAHGCTATGMITLTDPSNLVVTAVVDHQVSCFGLSDGQATATATNGVAPYSYLWNDPAAQTTPTATGLGAGVYTVTVTDASGNVSNASVTISEPEELIVNISGINPSVPGGNDGQATASVSGGTPAYSYLWDDPAAQTTATATGLTAGTYHVTVTDAHGCIATNLITLTDPASDLSVTAVVDKNVSCFGFSDGQATATATNGVAPYSYLWSDPAAQTTATATGLAAGTYTVSVTDATNTTVTASVTIAEPEELIVNVTGINPTTPGGNDGQATANVTGGTPLYSYLWDDPAAQTTATATGLTAGTYHVTVTDAHGCSTTGQIILTDPIPGLDVTIVVDQHASCFGHSDGQATATATGGVEPYSYLWNDPAAQTSATASGLIAGDYTITVTDAAGSTATASVTIEEPGQLSATVIHTEVSCIGALDGEISFTNITGGSGNYEYSIDGGTNWSSDATFEGLAAGTYDIWLGDANKAGCTMPLGLFIVTSPPAILASYDTIPATCGENNGKIIITSSGGTGAHEYMIEGIGTWQSLNEFGSLASATYTVLVRDSHGCEERLNGIVVTAAEGPAIIEVSCTPANDGQPDGIAEIIADSPAKPLEYSMNGTLWQSTDTFYGLLPGNYTAYVKDANGCITSLGFIIQNLINGEVELMAGRVIGCVNTPVGVPVLAYDFTNVSGFTIELSYDPGVIEFTGISQYNPALNAAGVTTSFMYPGVLRITYQNVGATTVPGGDLLFSLGFNAIAPGNTDLEWHWLQCVIYASAGYEIPAIYTQGLAEVLPSPMVFTSPDGVYCEEDTLTLHAGSLDNQQLAFEWTGPSGFKYNGSDWQLGRLGMNDGGQYQLIATNPDFCNTTKLVSVKVNPKPVIYIGYADTICYGQQVLLAPGSGYASYLWQDGSTAESQLVYEQGIYWVQVVDTNSCKAVDTVQLVPCNIELLIPNAFTPNGDNLNDSFIPYFNGFEPSLYNMSIYSKWGQLLFTSSDAGKGWDGTIEGVPAPPGVYVYVISYEAPSYVTRTLSSPVTGDVTIIK
ncbi:MAG: gliding motility-associated C-terminal domain-containing protein [Bacteroidales bacterium]|nr:gliding motility-associated C-terminal domain-containing protein [Bacteroidales bacterium]